MNNPPSLTPSPPLGWNSFDGYGSCLDEVAAYANLEALARLLKPHGYEYFVVDIGWYREFELVPGTKSPASTTALALRMHGYGRYLPSQTYFPNGLQPLAERTHALGLKLGLHLMRGIPRPAVERDLPILGTEYHAADVANRESTCRWCPDNYGVDMSKPGAQAYYDSVIALLAEWGVDFVKVDDVTGFPEEIQAVANAIERCGRPMVLSLSPGGNTDRQHLAEYRRADMLRTTKDIWDDLVSLERAFTAWREWQELGGNGFWPDLDMIPFGQLLVRYGVVSPSGQQAALHGKGGARTCQLTRNQQETFMAMRALAASPLFVGGDLPTMDASYLELLTNAGMLACNQNGVVGRLVYERDGVEVWRTPHRDDSARGWFGVFNRTEQPISVTLGPEELGLQQQGEVSSWQLHDVWRGCQLASVTATHPGTFSIGPDGVAFCGYTACS